MTKPAHLLRTLPLAALALAATPVRAEFPYQVDSALDRMNELFDRYGGQAKQCHSIVEQSWNSMELNATCRDALRTFARQLRILNNTIASFLDDPMMTSSERSDLRRIYDNNLEMISDADTAADRFSARL